MRIGRLLVRRSHRWISISLVVWINLLFSPVCAQSTSGFLVKSGLPSDATLIPDEVTEDMSETDFEIRRAEMEEFIERVHRQMQLKRSEAILTILPATTPVISLFGLIPITSDTSYRWGESPETERRRKGEAWDTVMHPDVVAAVPGITAAERQLLERARPALSAAKKHSDRLEQAGISEQTQRYLAIALDYVLQRETPVEFTAQSERKSRISGTLYYRYEGQADPSDSHQHSVWGPVRNTIKLTIRSRAFVAAMAVRNDPGESLQWRPDLGWYGFDHLSAYVRWGPASRPIVITAGNFAVEAGQGMIWSRPFGQRRDAASPHRSIRHSTRVRSLASTSGVPHLTGIAAELQISQRIRTIWFASRRQHDARFVAPKCYLHCTDGSLATDGDSFWKLISTNSHVSEDQLDHKNAVSSSSMGSVVEYTSGPMTIGVSHGRTLFDHPVVWGPRFKATSAISSSSAFGSWTMKQFSLSGEWSFERAVSAGGVLGATFHPGRHTHAIILLRAFDSRQTGLNTDRTAISMNLGQQWTLLNGWRYAPGAGWLMAASFEYRSGMDVVNEDLGRRYRVDTRIFAEISAIPNTRLRLQYRQTHGQEIQKLGTASSATVDFLDFETTEQLSAELTSNITDNLETQTRLDVKSAAVGEKAAGNGFHMHQQFTYQPTMRTRITLRLSLFEVAHSSSRIFVYDPDVSGKLSTSSFSDSGYRFMLLVETRNLLGFGLELKFAQTNATEILPELNGSVNRTYGPSESGQRLTIQISRSL